MASMKSSCYCISDLVFALYRSMDKDYRNFICLVDLLWEELINGAQKMKLHLFELSRIYRKLAVATGDSAQTIIIVSVGYTASPASAGFGCGASRPAGSCWCIWRWYLPFPLHDFALEAYMSVSQVKGKREIDIKKILSGKNVFRNKSMSLVEVACICQSRVNKIGTYKDVGLY